MKIKYLILSIAILLLASAVFADVNLDRLQLKRANGETILKIDVSGPFQFTHQIEDAKDGKPFRVIVDLFPAVHNLGQKIFAALPPSIVTSIRTSQYAVKPEKVVRVVLDLKEPSVYRIEKSGNFACLYIPDSKTADFPEWASASDNPIPTPAPVVTASAEKEPKRAEGLKPQPATVQNNAVVPAPEPVVTASVEKESKPAEVEKENVTVISTPEVTVSEAQNQPAPPQSRYIKPKQSSLIERDMAAEERKPVPTATPSIQTGAQVAQSEAKPSEKQTEPPVISTTVPAQTVTTPVTAPQPIKQEEKEPIVAAVTPAPAKSEAKNIGIAPITDSSVNQDDIYFDSDVVAGGVSADDMPAVEGPGTNDSAASKSTSRFRREPAMPTKLKGTIVAEFPQRMVIEYAPGVFRDPFETLIDDAKPSDESRENKIPDVETSRLVGILEAGTGNNRAILEDIDGYGYILKSGDKVQKGFVDRIEGDKAFFQLFEFGWSRTIALYLGHN